METNLSDIPEIEEPGEPREAGTKAPFLKITEHNTYRIQLTLDPKLDVTTKFGKRHYVTGLLIGTTDKTPTVSSNQQKRQAQINELVTLSASQTVLKTKIVEADLHKDDVVDIMFKGKVKDRRYFDFDVKKYSPGQTAMLER